METNTSCSNNTLSISLAKQLVLKQLNLVMRRVTIEIRAIEIK